METAIPQPVLPWTGLPEEKRRFRLIYGQVLAIFLVISCVVPYLSLPVSEEEVETKLPPRIARILTDRQKPVAEPPAPARVTTPLPVPAPRPEHDSKPVIASSVGKSRVEQPARNKSPRPGILAMSDALKELRDGVPDIAASDSGQYPVIGDSRGKSGRSSRLVAGVTGGSEGIDADVISSQTVIGARGLPGRELTSVQSPIAGMGTSAQGRDTSGNRSGLVRTEDEIQEILDRNKSAMYTLYNRELRTDPDLQGKIVISITIATSGKVTRCDIVYSELDSASLKQKLVRLIKAIDFGNKPGVPIVTTSVPIEFFPI